MSILELGNLKRCLCAEGTRDIVLEPLDAAQGYSVTALMPAASIPHFQATLKMQRRAGWLCEIKCTWRLEQLEQVHWVEEARATVQDTSRVRSSCSPSVGARLQAQDGSWTNEFIMHPVWFEDHPATFCARAFVPPGCLRRLSVLLFTLTFAVRPEGIVCHRLHLMPLANASAGIVDLDKVSSASPQHSWVSLERIGGAKSAYENVELQFLRPSAFAPESAFNRLHPGGGVHVIGQSSTLGHWLALRSALSRMHIAATRLHYTVHKAAAFEAQCKGVSDGLMRDAYSPLHVATLVLAQCSEFVVATATAAESDAFGARIAFLDDCVQPHMAFEQRVYEVAKWLPAEWNVLLWGGGRSVPLDSALTLPDAFAPVYSGSITAAMDSCAHCAFSLSPLACRVFRDALCDALQERKSHNDQDNDQGLDTDTLIQRALRHTIASLSEAEESGVYVCNPFLFQVPSARQAKCACVADSGRDHAQIWHRTQVAAESASRQYYRAFVVPDVQEPLPESSSAFRVSVLLLLAQNAGVDAGERLLCVTQSLLSAQTYRNVELLCVDFGAITTANASALTKQAAQHKTNLLLVSAEPNETICQTCARAVRLATGRFLLWINVDDEFTSNPERIARQVSVMLCSQYVICACERGLSTKNRFDQQLAQRIALQQRQFELCMFRRADVHAAMQTHPSVRQSLLSSSESLFATFARVATAHGANASELDRDNTASYARLRFYHCVPIKLVLH